MLSALARLRHLSGDRSGRSRRAWRCCASGSGTCCCRRARGAGWHPPARRRPTGCGSPAGASTRGCPTGRSKRSNSAAGSSCTPRPASPSCRNCSPPAGTTTWPGNGAGRGTGHGTGPRANPGPRQESADAGRAAGAAGRRQPHGAGRPARADARRTGRRDRGAAAGRARPARHRGGAGRAGADALVYLLLAEDEQTVRALLVPAGDGGQTRELPLPGLAAGTPLTSARRRTPGCSRPTSTRTRRTARANGWPPRSARLHLGREAVVSPLLKAVPAGLPQLVIVPTGSLSLVPWHAARCADDDGGWSYACARAVFTYAASGRQYAEVTQRPKLPPGQSPVIVADPTSSLDASGRRRRGRSARQLLPAGPLPRAGDRHGRPGRARLSVLAVLPSAASAGASMLHVAGARPTWKRAVPTGRSWSSRTAGR